MPKPDEVERRHVDAVKAWRRCAWPCYTLPEFRLRAIQWYRICPGFLNAIESLSRFNESVMERVAGKRRPTVLVIEPDPLLRWSLTNYLGRFFQVLAVESTGPGRRLVQGVWVDALITSDDLGPDAETLRQFVRKSNPSVLAVRMIAKVPGEDLPPGYLRIEKPFQLPALAELLWDNLPPIASHPASDGRNRVPGL